MRRTERRTHLLTIRDRPVPDAQNNTRAHTRTRIVSQEPVLATLRGDRVFLVGHEPFTVRLSCCWAELHRSGQAAHCGSFVAHPLGLHRRAARAGLNPEASRQKTHRSLGPLIHFVALSGLIAGLAIAGTAARARELHPHAQSIDKETPPLTGPTPQSAMGASRTANSSHTYSQQM